MSTAKAAVVESISKRRFGGLSSRLRKAPPSRRLERIKEMAGVLLEEAASLDQDSALNEALMAPESFDLKSGIDFFSEVRRFEIRIIRLALKHTGGNQARAARLLGLRTTTLNYKIKQYQLA